MDENFDIELNEESSEVSNVVRLPMNFLTFGEIENDDIKVYIKQDVYKDLEKYALEDTQHERGTIILGDYCEEMGKTHVVISNYIEAKYTDASASTLTFTHETWDYVHKEQDAKYPNKKIVGWQHTHPTYGIFLSNYDLFIHENFFNLPFQVAYVIDPVQNLRGFFQWKNGKIEKLKGFYIYDEVGKSIKIEQKQKEDKKNSITQQGGKPIYVILTLLCVMTLALSFFSFSIIRKYNSQIKMQNDILAKVESQDKVIENLQEQLVNSILDENGTTTVSDLIEKIENQEIILQNQDKVLKELQSFIEQKKTGESGEVTFKAYTVVMGDTLEKICIDNGIDYYSSKGIILSINGIENPNQICIDQTILLPIIND